MSQLVQQLSWFALSDRGLVREQNEDVWGALPEKAIFALADGMGGHKAGEVAASMACAQIFAYFEEKAAIDPELDLASAFRKAAETVYSMGLLHEEYQGMGTTLDCLLLAKGKAFFAHVGDSRIYLLREHNLTQLTVDHTLVRELIDLGAVTQEEAELLPFKHTLTRAIGIGGSIDADIGGQSAESGDLFLLCSDGLVNFVKDSEIQARLDDKGATLEQKAHALVDLAKEQGGGDNITVVLVSLDDLSR